MFPAFIAEKCNCTSEKSIAKKKLRNFAKLGALDDLGADLAVAIGAEVLEEVAARLLHLAEAQTPSRHDSTSEV